MEQNEQAAADSSDDEEKDAEIEALRKILMDEHRERLAKEKLEALNKAEENPGSIKKEKKKKMKRKGKRKERKQKWDLTPSSKLTPGMKLKKMRKKR